MRKILSVSYKKNILMLSGLGVILCITSSLLPPVKAQTPSPILESIKQANTRQWRLATDEEKAQIWQYLLNSRLGIAALNQLAIEGFISPNCPKTWYIDRESGGFITLLRVKCPEPRGASIAIGYDEIRVIFSRFEDNIEDFKIERVSKQEGILGTPLPDE